ncbi:MAG: PrgI family protein [Patescibacteria group bacterium]|jgi:hypothetical protein
MRYKVPQNIDMQDRIIGPLTMIQFIYAIVGTGAAYSLYMTLPKPLNLIAAVPVLIFTICIVFIKINERPFLNFFLAMIEFLSAPKKRVWHHGSVDNLKVIIYSNKDNSKQKAAVKHVSEDEIKKLAKKLDEN